MSPHSIILLGVLQFTAKGLSSTVPMNSAASNGNKELDSATSQSNHQPQYVLPPPSNHPMPIMHPNLVPQYPGPPQQQQLSSGYGVMDDIKSDISTLRDSVLLLSNLVKQNSMNSEGRTLYPNDNSKYEKPDYRPGDTGYYDSPAPKKGYKDEAVKAKDTVDEKVVVVADKTGDTPKQDQPSLLSGLLPSLSTNLRSGLIGHAERTFAIIKRGIRNALVTGLIVAAVRLIPLLWFGLKLIFNAILPLVGISLQGTNQYARAFSLATDTKPTDTSSDTTPKGHSLFTRDVLDDDLDNLESSFDLFKKWH